MKPLKVWFSDFWFGFEPEKSLFFSSLNEQLPTVLDPSPDLLICSVFGDQWKKFDCKKVWYTGERIGPDLSLFDYTISFDPSNERNLYYPLFRLWPGYEKCFQEREISVADWQKKKTVNFVYSNIAAGFRTRFFHQLNKDIDVASGGRLFNNIGGPVEDKIAFLNEFKYTIAFENTIWPGYTTEKLLEAYYAGGIPVFSGDPLSEQWLNSESVVAYHSSKDYKNVLETLRHGSSDFDYYRSKYRQPLFKDNKEPSAWSRETLDMFFAQVLEGPRHTKKQSVHIVNWKNARIGYMMGRRNHYKDRWIISVKVYTVFNLLYVLKAAKSLLKKALVK